MLKDYTISLIDGRDYTILFNFDDGSTSEQTIHFIAEDATDLDNQIQQYAVAYQAGLKVEQEENTPVIPDDIQSLVAKPQNIADNLAKKTSIDLKGDTENVTSPD